MTAHERGASNPADETQPATTTDGATASDPSFGALFGAAARNAGIGQVAPGEIPTASSLLSAVGGVRGLAETILPPLAFLVLYTLTGELVLSVTIPVVVAVVFVLARLLTKTPVTGALAGVAGVAISAVVALSTGRPEDNFLPGLIINAVSLTAILISIIVRYPFIGLVVGILANEGLEWRKDRAKRRVLTLTTVLWAGLFAVRLGAQLPLYLAGEVELLATVKLILGVPTYAVLLWITWLLVRAVYRRGVVTPAE
ncbi:DUF3159 domain-containing protein [Marisediminicola sp. LYQ134]|uniref:DUF3159 domain-containing protein n=1 Tax=unclassified Marisediminicola TaxID=2618316 RepID=UPI0039837F07